MEIGVQTPTNLVKVKVKRFSKKGGKPSARILGLNNLEIKSSPRKSKILLLETVLLNKGTNVFVVRSNGERTLQLKQDFRHRLNQFTSHRI